MTKRGAIISLTYKEATALLMACRSGMCADPIVGPEFKSITDKIDSRNPDLNGVQFALWEAAGKPYYQSF
jgi:hypothetical protein